MNNNEEFEENKNNLLEIFLNKSIRELSILQFSDVFKKNKSLHLIIKSLSYNYTVQKFNYRFFDKNMNREIGLLLKRNYFIVQTFFLNFYIFDFNFIFQKNNFSKNL
jgi:hypothetical protein